MFTASSRVARCTKASAAKCPDLFKLADQAGGTLVLALRGLSEKQGLCVHSFQRSTSMPVIMVPFGYVALISCFTDSQGRNGLVFTFLSTSYCFTIAFYAPLTLYCRMDSMNREKVIFAFFIVLALTLNFGFFLGDIDNPAHHNVFEFFAAIVVSMICTVLKFGDRTHIGALMLATSLVADLQLVVAAMIWGYGVQLSTDGMTTEMISSVVSLSGGALLANIVSVILLMVETIVVRR